MIVRTLSRVVDASQTTTTVHVVRRSFLALVTVSLIGLVVAPAVDLPSTSVASAQNQMELNKEACDEYKKADAEMNAVYAGIRRDYRGDTAFIAALRKAQLAWIRYRDAQLNSIFPGDRSQYGSINTMCRCNDLAELTKERTQVLNRWVEGIEEGDVCAGSVKVK